MFTFIPECPLSLALHLPDPLVRDRKLLTKVGECGWLLAVQPVAADEDAALTLGELLDGIHKVIRLQLSQHFTSHIRLTLVLEEITELRAVLLRGERLVEA